LSPKFIQMTDWHNK